MSINNMVLLIGYVANDLRTKILQGGAKQVRIRMATHEQQKTGNGHNIRRTTWHDIVAWDTVAELAERTFVKGSHIRVNRTIRYRTYHDATGHKRHVTEIKAEYLQNLDR